MSMRPSLRIGVLEIFTLCCLYLLVHQQMDFFSDDPGVGWHLQTGEYILRTGIIPRYDPFLASPVFFTPRPPEGARAWISDQWLSDVLFALLFRWGSWPLLYACLSILYLAAFVWLPFSSVMRRCSSVMVGTFAVFVAFRLGTIHFILRPVLLSFLFFALLLRMLAPYYEALCDSAKRIEAERNFRKLLYWLPPVFALWANMHPSFVLGFAVLAILPLSLCVDVFFHGIRTHAPKQTDRCVLLLLVCVLATLLNPYGWALHKSILDLGASSLFMDLNQEWRAINFALPEGQYFEGLWIGVLLAAFLVPKAFPKLRSFEIFLPLAFAHACLNGVRFLPYFGLVSVVPLAEVILSFSKLRLFIEGREYLQSTVTKLSSRVRSAQLEQSGTLGLVLIVAIFLAVTLWQGRVPLYGGEYGPRRDKFPYGAIDFIRTQQPANGETIRVLSTPDWGGFITFMGNEKIRALIDDRNTLLGEEFVQGFLDFMHLKVAWREYALRLEAHYILMPKDSSLALTLKQYEPTSITFEDAVSVLIKVAAQVAKQSPVAPG